VLGVPLEVGDGVGLPGVVGVSLGWAAGGDVELSSPQAAVMPRTATTSVAPIRPRVRNALTTRSFRVGKVTHDGRPESRPACQNITAARLSGHVAGSIPNRGAAVTSGHWPQPPLRAAADNPSAEVMRAELDPGSSRRLGNLEA